MGVAQERAQSTDRFAICNVMEHWSVVSRRVLVVEHGARVERARAKCIFLAGSLPTPAGRGGQVGTGVIQGLKPQTPEASTILRPTCFVFGKEGEANSAIF
jgi:hypothetical protein